MKILLIHHFGGIGGGTNSCLDVASLLVAKGHDVMISIPSPDESVVLYCLKNNISLDIVDKPVPCFTYHNVSSSLLREFFKHLRVRKLLIWWKTHIDEINPDAIMLNSIAQLPLCSVVRNRKCICFIRETKKYGGLIGNMVLKSLMKKATALVFLTTFDQEDWNLPSSVKQFVLPDFVSSHLFFKPNESVQTIRNGLNIDKRCKIILYLGGLNYAKGGFDLIKAYNMIKKNNSDIKLVVLGNTYSTILQNKRNIVLRPLAYIKLLRYTRMVKKINEEKQNIILVGPVSDVNVWYYISDVVVFPVRLVHQARPVYEAGYYSKPVVLPDYANFKEALVDGYNGRFYKKRNVKSMAYTLIDILKTEDIISYGENNYLMYKEGHSEEYALSCLSKIIEKL